jgi:hypothetical protein
LNILKKFNAKMQIEPEGLYSSQQHPLSSRNGAFQCQVCFPSTNMTAGTQPLDFGIIRNFKVKYCNMFLEFLLSHEDVIALANAVKKVNVGDAIDWVSQSWDQVVASTIKICL